MGAKWLIVADDLTGAADCAIAFAKEGVAAAVGWGDCAEDTGGLPPVFSYDANSRGLTGPDALARHCDVLGKLHGEGTALFKKVDSTLRGQPAAETVAVFEALRSRSRPVLGIMSPAFPATGRTTRDGRVHVGGEPLEQTEVWQREHSYPDADLVRVLATAGIEAEKVPLATVRAGAEALRAALDGIASRGDRVAVCDAETEDDLARIAEASLPVRSNVFWIGSAGLAHALAKATRGEAVGTIPTAVTGNGALVVVGSLARASRSAAKVLSALPGLRHVPIEPELLLSETAVTDRATLVDRVTAALQAGEDVLVEILVNGAPDLALGPCLADRLADLLRPAAPHASGLAATGGETAAALLARFGVNGIRLVDEVEPGVSLGLTLGDLSIPIVTKAGAFGNENTLAHVVRRLRTIRQEGKLA
ncbi:four-carbon acid sugar kinase family protein [Microvirga sp. KLBC 81]|uniref:four-carbon acid sugar kinase family protein n=1 Tax=Microvirga sp. KLBC 81 TaxID=1862707 RepID=UPI000D518281|nr:four-carbon acid sugar kinase family protein [Microvirga sp. KLBC 81]PVE21125.1 four-carbon acid sugar kinase family protein [Microvirga sp. KLBC 81]